MKKGKLLSLSVTILTTFVTSSAHAQLLPSCGCGGNVGQNYTQPTIASYASPANFGTSPFDRRLAQLSGQGYQPQAQMQQGEQFNQMFGSNVSQTQNPVGVNGYEHSLRPRLYYSAGCQTTTDAFSSLGAFISNALFGANCDASVRIQNY